MGEVVKKESARCTLEGARKHSINATCENIRRKNDFFHAVFMLKIYRGNCHSFTFSIALLGSTSSWEVEYGSWVLGRPLFHPFHFCFLGNSSENC